MTAADLADRSIIWQEERVKDLISISCVKTFINHWHARKEFSTKNLPEKVKVFPHERLPQMQNCYRPSLSNVKHSPFYGTSQFSLRSQTILYGVVAPHSLIALGCHNSTINHNKVCWLDKEMNRACSLKTRLCCGTGRGAAYPLKTQQLGVHPFHMWLVCLFTCNNDIIWHTSVYLAHSSVFCREMHGEGTDCYTLMLPKPVRA